MRDVLLLAAAAAASAMLLLVAAGTYRCCDILLLLLTQLPSWGLGQPPIGFAAERRGCGSFSYSFVLSHFYFPASLDNSPWSQASSLPPPGKCLHFYRAEGSSFPTLVGYSSIFAHSRAVGSSSLYATKRSYEHEHALGET